MSDTMDFLTTLAQVVVLMQHYEDRHNMHSGMMVLSIDTDAPNFVIYQRPKLNPLFAGNEQELLAWLTEDINGNPTGN